MAATSSNTRAQMKMDAARKELLAVTAPMRSRMFSQIGESIKASTLADPDMWKWVKNGLNSALSQTWSDFEHECERSLQAAVLRQEFDEDVKGPEGTLCLPYLAFRKFFLHHYLPHNRSLFGKLNDPLFLVLYMLTLLPVHGVRVCIFAVLLVCLALPGKPDEFQLINYILNFKGMQFITSGLIQTIVGSMKYFACYSLYKDTLAECVDNHGPGAKDGTGLLIDYAGNITLVWIAFSLLPYSKRCTRLHEPGENDCTADAEAKRQDREAGGRLRHLLMYDIKCFGVSLLLLLVLTICTCWSFDGSHVHFKLGSQMNANIFWCCVFYSLLSMPFAIFEVPVLRTILTHCDSTGFNEHGACVAFQFAAAPTQVGSPTFAGKTMMSATAKVVKILERGRQRAGGARKNGDLYMGADLVRGLLPPLFVRSTDGNAGRSGDGLISPKSRGGMMFGREPREPSEPRSPKGNAFLDGVHEVVNLGKEARGGNSGEEYRVGDFSRGVVKKLMPEMKRKESAKTNALRQDNQLPLGVASVRMKPDVKEDERGVQLFCLEVHPEASIGGDVDFEAWEVEKSYDDFCRLRNKLGVSSYSEAPFPRWYWQKQIGEKLDARREALAVWIQRVMVDADHSRSQWRRQLRKFLMADDIDEDAGQASMDLEEGGFLRPQAQIQIIDTGGSVPQSPSKGSADEGNQGSKSSIAGSVPASPSRGSVLATPSSSRMGSVPGTPSRRSIPSTPNSKGIKATLFRREAEHPALGPEAEEVEENEEGAFEPRSAAADCSPPSPVEGSPQPSQGSEELPLASETSSGGKPRPLQAALQRSSQRFQKTLKKIEAEVTKHKAERSDLQSEAVPRTQVSKNKTDNPDRQSEALARSEAAHSASPFVELGPEHSRRSRRANTSGQ